VNSLENASGRDVACGLSLGMRINSDRAFLVELCFKTSENV